MIELFEWLAICRSTFLYAGNMQCADICLIKLGYKHVLSDGIAVCKLVDLYLCRLSVNFIKGSL
jgi:hypothetical protein